MDKMDENECQEGPKEPPESNEDSEMNNLKSNSTVTSNNLVNEVINLQNIAPKTTDESEKENSNSKAVEDIKNSENCLLLENLRNEDLQLNALNCESETNARVSEAVIKINRPLCADYRSDSDSESVDSESDSSLSSTDTTTESSSDTEDDSDDSCITAININKSNQVDKKSTRELTIYDLPPIEDLQISVPEDDCVEIGTITSIVDTLVVVESYKGSAALDIDTVLFLDNGKRSLGKVFDILGPITEPVYAVRFNSQEQIKDLTVEKGLKVYYAPKTKHTNFVFMSEVLKNKGSDASWKDNTEAPPEFQDFSDDEEERLHQQEHKKDQDGENSRDLTKSRKRPFTQFKQSRIIQPNSFRNPNFSPQRRPQFQNYPPGNQYNSPQSFPRPNFGNPYPPSPYHCPPPTPYHCPPPPMYFPQRITGRPFPTFGGIPFVNQNQNFQPYYQQRAHPGPQNYGAWGMMLRPPPPPPPPLTEQSDQQQQDLS